MNTEQLMVSGLIVATMGLFLWGRLRHDMVAMIALLAAVLIGLVPQDQAFSGFSQPAVITVACVLILSRGLQRSGAVDALARRVIPSDSGPVLAMATLCGLGAALSAFMNNVGALALLMPLAVRLSGSFGIAPGRLLMPLSFATILGGMVTLIGTPPNLIVSTFRADAGLGRYSMFDFTPVGLPVALAGIAFLVLLGWRLIPARETGAGEEFRTGAYFTELRVTDESALIGETLTEAETRMTDAGAQIVGLVRNGVALTAPRGSRLLIAGDILIVEAELDSVSDMLSSLGLKLTEDGAKTRQKDDAAQPDKTDDAPPGDGEILLREYVLRADSELVGRSAATMALRTRYGVNLLAVSRSGARMVTRLRSQRLHSGDLLLMQGPADALSEFASSTGAIALAERSLDLPDKRGAILASAIMIGAIAVAAMGLLPTAVSFAAGAVLSVLLRLVPLRELYTSIDWPVIVLLAALIPVAGAMETTGAAGVVATWLVDTLAGDNAVIALALVLIVTMTLSDVMNNAATAAVMCPIALNIATLMGLDADAFLMAVAIGGSCAFLTPIGHQNNTLILGPGGFRFGDFWRPGIVMEIIVVAVSLPLLAMFWL